MRRIALPLNINRAEFNINNLHENDPYMIDPSGNLVLDTSWWNGLTQYIRDLLKPRLDEKYIFDDIKIPHEIQYDPRLAMVHRSFHQGYDYNVWYNETPCAPQGVQMIKLTDAEKQALHLKDRDGSETLRHRISEVLNNNPGIHYFIRTSSTSGKNEKSIKSYDRSDDIVEHLIDCEEFDLREFSHSDKPTHIIMVPWNPWINQRNEFRIFVVKRKLSCCSPQRWWESHDYTEDELTIIENAILGSEIYKDSPYETFVADVYVDFEEKECRLIELNCFGDYSGAGSSLFNWRTDRDLLYGKSSYKLPEFRYLSVISVQTMKHYVGAQELLERSYELGKIMIQDNFKPTFIIGIWRGGAPVGISIQEMYKYLGQKPDHISIRTSSYTSIGEQQHNIRVHGLEYVIENANQTDSVLLVDDIFDSGRSLEAVISKLRLKMRDNLPHDIRIGTIFYKPQNRKTEIVPNYYVSTTEQWVIFPHEIEEMSICEIEMSKGPVIGGIMKELCHVE
jgi:uncharacterized protein